MKRRKRTPQQERRTLWNRAFEQAKVIVRARSGGRCERCRTAIATAFHHKLMGRTHPRCNEPEHIAHVCLLCHTEIHGHPAQAHEAGWLLHDWDVPRDAA